MKKLLLLLPFLLLTVLVSLNNFSPLKVLVVVLFVLALYFINVLWVKPERLRKKLERQGIKGPRPSNFLYGNVQEMQKIQAISIKEASSNFGEFIAHDYTSTLFPYFEQWRKQYGNILNPIDSMK